MRSVLSTRDWEFLAEGRENPGDGVGKGEDGLLIGEVDE